MSVQSVVKRIAEHPAYIALVYIIAALCLVGYFVYWDWLWLAAAFILVISNAQATYNYLNDK